jgi:hypothetical protein
MKVLLYCALYAALVALAYGYVLTGMINLQRTGRSRWKKCFLPLFLLITCKKTFTDLPVVVEGYGTYKTLNWHSEGYVGATNRGSDAAVAVRSDWGESYEDGHLRGQNFTFSAQNQGSDSVSLALTGA